MTAQYFMNGVVVGNILGNDSIALVSDIVDALNYKAATQASLLTEEIVNLTGQALVYRELSSQNNSDDNCILNYYQDGPRNQKNFTLLNLLNLVLDNDVYQYFRGDLALGYIATSIVDVTDNVTGLNIIIQGSVDNPNQMDQVIEIFLQNYESELASMSDDDFTGLVSSLNGSLSQAYTSLEEEAQAYMGKIRDGSDDFNSRLEMIEILETLTLDDLVTYFTNLFSTECKKLSIQIYSNDNNTATIPTTLLAVNQTYCGNKPVLIDDIYNLETYPSY